MTMLDSADENAMRILLNDQEDTANRIASARHLENVETEASFSALLNVAQSPEEDGDLLAAVGRSLAKVAAATGRGGDVTDLNPAARAAYGDSR